jgi:hypothetical protein
MVLRYARLHPQGGAPVLDPWFIAAAALGRGLCVRAGSILFSVEAMAVQASFRHYSRKIVALDRLRGGLVPKAFGTGVRRCGLVLAMLTISIAGSATARADDPVNATYGVHNPPETSNCDPKDCIYPRSKDEPSDPLYPSYWTSDWTMYTVSQHYVDFPPPYPGRPPQGLKEGSDYTVSYGTTYYDSTWTDGIRKGAMMEHYDRHCLPIFPIKNNFTCSFISLGDIAFFVTYGDRPKDMPPVCLFSPLNHPPGRDFIKHLPYAKGDSDQLLGRVQGYSFWVGQGGAPVQVGVRPDRTADQDILFGYAFESLPRPDAVDRQAEPYRHPQSFYFSGYPLDPPNAPIVSQNYTNFAMVRPDPKATWRQVEGLDYKKLPPCHLFQPLAPPKPLAQSGAGLPPTWGSIGKNQ